MIIASAILFSFTTNVSAQVRDAALNKTKGYIVFAMGFNTLSNSQKAIYDNLDFAKSRFYEIGYARNTRLSKKSNLLHLNYGLSFVYNNIRVKNGYTFKQEEKEVVAQYSSEVSKTKLRNSYIQVPIYVEFDFASQERLSNPNKILKKGFKVGLGGFIGVKMKTRQFINNKDGNKVTHKNIKTNKFTYGIGTYIGYSFASFYIKYDIQGMFEYNRTNNPHNVSLGLRLDI